MAEGRLGGEFFTPYSIVRLIVEIIEPFHGKVFVLETPARGARFTVATVDDHGLVLLLGEQEARTRFSWEALEVIGEVFGGAAVYPSGLRTAPAQHQGSSTPT